MKALQGPPGEPTSAVGYGRFSRQGAPARYVASRAVDRDGERGIALLAGELERPLGGPDRVGESARLGVGRGQRIEDRGLAPAREPHGALGQRHRLGPVAHRRRRARGEGPRGLRQDPDVVRHRAQHEPPLVERRRGASRLVEGGREADVGLDGVGSECDRLPEPKDRLLRLPLAQEGEAEAALQRGRAGVEGHRLLEVRRRLPRLALLEERHPEVGAGPQELGVEGHRPLEAQDPLVEPAALGERRPEVGQRLGVLGVDLEGLLVARDRLGDPACRHERGAEAALGLVEVGVERDRLLEVRDRLGRLSRRGQGGPEAVLRPVVVGVERERLLPRRDGRRVAALLRERRRLVEEAVELGRRRVDLQQPVGRRCSRTRGCSRRGSPPSSSRSGSPGCRCRSRRCGSGTSACRATGSSTRRPSSARSARSCARSS